MLIREFLFMRLFWIISSTFFTEGSRRVTIPAYPDFAKSPDYSLLSVFAVLIGAFFL